MTWAVYALAQKQLLQSFPSAGVLLVLMLIYELNGGVAWLLHLLGYQLSVAVGVGLIALAGVAVELGVVMLVYLQLAWRRQLEACRAAGRAPGEAEIEAAANAPETSDEPPPEEGEPR